MRWRHRSEEHREQLDRAQRAIETADQQLAEASARMQEDRGRIAIFRRWQLENHFSERFEQILKGGDK